VVKNPVLESRIVKFYLLEGVRSPESWLFKNQRVINSKVRYQSRIEIRKLLATSSMRFADDDQYLFVAGELGNFEILEGEILSPTKLAIEDGILIADLVSGRMIFEEKLEDGYRLWQCSETGWNRARRPNKARPEDTNNHLDEFKAKLAKDREELEIRLAQIRARRQELALQIGAEDK
jgi:hypothetical protein